MPSVKDIINEGVKLGYSKKEIYAELSRKGYTRKEIEDAFNEKNVSKSKQKESDLDYWGKIKLIFSNPVMFFKTVREPSIKDSFLLYLGVGILASLLSYGVSMLFARSFFGYFLGSNPFGYAYLYMGIGIFLISLVAIFAYAGIIQFVAKRFGGTGNYTDSFNACAYSAIPGRILMVIPIIGFLAFIYSIVLAVIGVSEYHNISKGKATAVVLIPIGVIIAIFVLLAIWLIFSLRGIF